MFGRKRFKKLWIPMLALNLVPLVASGDDQARPVARGPKFDDLTASELVSSFRNFDAVKEAQDPNSRVVLYGMVFNDCKEHFEISNTRLDASIKGAGVIGFRISDAGGKGRACMAAHSKDTCSAATPCTRLSQLPGASLDMSSDGDVKAQIVHLDPDRDRDQLQWEDLGKEINHVGAATIRAQRAADEKRRKENLVKVLQKQVANCRKTSADRDTARTAAEMLSGLGLMTEEAIERLNKELTNAELQALSREFLKLPLNNPERMAEMTEQLKQFEAEHPEAADQIAVLLHQKALAYAKAAKNPDGYDRASELISEAQGLTGLNDVAAARLDNYQRDITVGRFQLQAQSGNADPYGFWQPYQNFMWSLQSDMRGCSGQNMNNEGCRSMVQAYRTASQIPQRAQQSQYEQYMFYMQMQQQMAQSMNMGGGFTNGGMQAGASQGSGFYR